MIRQNTVSLPLAAGRLWFAVLALAGCGAEPWNLARPLVEEHLAGDTVVRIAARPLYPGGGEFVADLVIGVTEGPEEYLFGNITSIAAGRDGSIFVLDARVPTVRRYDAGGRHVRSIGRRGSGPGEYDRPTHIGLGDDERLLVAEAVHRRIQVFDSAGAFIRTLSPPDHSVLLGSGGRIHVVGNGGAARLTLLLLDTLGAVLDTVPLPPDDPSAYLHFEPGYPGGPPRRELLPYADQPRWAWSSAGCLVTGRTRRYAVDIACGDSIVSIRRDAAPAPVPGEQRDLMRTSMRAYIARHHPDASVPAFAVPATKTAIHAIDVADDGRLWVAVTGESFRTDAERPRPGIPHAPGWNEIRSYDIFEPDGTWLGRVPHPDPGAGTRVRVMRGDTVWAQSSNEDGAPVVVRYRIAWR